MSTAITIENLRAIEWARDYLWDARFMGQGSSIGPFTNWFPATGVTENLATANNHTFEGFLSSYSVPLSSAEFTIDLMFLDDVTHSITDWLSDWINNGILNNGQYITTADKAMRMLQIRKLKPDMTVKTDTTYWVIPEGNMDFEGTSESGSHEYSMSFKVLGVRRLN